MDINLFSDRLILRNLQTKDWPNFLRLHLDKDINQYIRRIESESDIVAKFEQRKAAWQFESGEWLSLVIEQIDTNEFVGLIGFRCDDAQLNRAEVGYLIAPEKHGFGFATESLRAVTDWGALQFNMHKYIGICDQHNTASRRVLEKVGFILEGTLRHNNCIDQIWSDDCYMGLLTAQRE
ncbi:MULTISPECIES: GNAT family N-acetyltransferase [Shewanella]|jgi:RimJ/RimL family protein N-acetyltransferase|uniref:GNAT family N-acetyltransferase n=1 Tax=Shewanella TaxID=22 RepID=UPI0015FECA04|nr:MULTISPECIES: GNAT family protein [unclassified Shewanella]MBB1320479.1 GNAT family N-acetyltransferase [Shewanella sp. SR43-8]MBB1474568.1 GNAT family N-acetyltransferase [Shewanella sp. SG41-3]|tara:strand:+ start:4934 stop:5470 length:537 start_codon:yes stop_codon:yes gene_type:complete